MAIRPEVIQTVLNPLLLSVSHFGQQHHLGNVTILSGLITGLQSLLQHHPEAESYNRGSC